MFSTSVQATYVKIKQAEHSDEEKVEENREKFVQDKGKHEFG